MRFKLVSHKDTFLGHLDVPDHWRACFNRTGTATTCISPQPMTPSYTDRTAPSVEISRVTLVLAGWSRYKDAVILADGSLEELETAPGVAFTPSAAYLRSLHEGG